MLQLELAGASYVTKAFIRREIKVAGRSRGGAVEFKSQNVSAVLQKRVLPFVDGYKPSANFQTMLVEVVNRRLATSFGHLTSVREIAPPIVKPEVVPSTSIGRMGEKPAQVVSPRYVDWAAVKSGLRALGRVGEAYQKGFERDRLTSAGRSEHAGRVVWVADQTRDGDGHDIRSYSEDRNVLYIEVKTTVGGIEMPFFLTGKEIYVLQELNQQYRLHRFFDFAKLPKLYILRGALTSSCALTPATYSALRVAAGQ